MLRRAFEGIHPTFKQVPPNLGYFSIQAVFNPNYEAFIEDT